MHAGKPKTVEVVPPREDPDAVELMREEAAIRAAEADLFQKVPARCQALPARPAAALTA